MWLSVLSARHVDIYLGRNSGTLILLCNAVACLGYVSISHQDMIRHYGDVSRELNDNCLNTSGHTGFPMCVRLIVRPWTFDFRMITCFALCAPSEHLRVSLSYHFWSETGKLQWWQLRSRVIARGNKFLRNIVNVVLIILCRIMLSQLFILQNSLYWYTTIYMWVCVWCVVWCVWVWVCVRVRGCVCVKLITGSGCLNQCHHRKLLRPCGMVKVLLLKLGNPFASQGKT